MHRYATVPAADQIVVGAVYDPRLLEDYAGPCFTHDKHRLMQHDAIDNEGKLIPPWTYYDQLRPGTVVLITATLHCFRFNVNTPGRNERKVRVDSRCAAFTALILQNVHTAGLPDSRYQTGSPREITPSRAAPCSAYHSQRCGPSTDSCRFHCIRRSHPHHLGFACILVQEKAGEAWCQCSRSVRVKAVPSESQPRWEEH